MRNSNSIAGWRALGIASVAALFLSSCASFSPDGGMDAVRDTVKARSGKDVQVARTESDRAAMAERAKGLLAQPLTADDAVQVALLNNAGLQASLHELGIAEADLVASGRLPNPRLGVSRGTEGGATILEAQLGFNVLSLLTVPIAHQAEQRRFDRTRNAVALEVLKLGYETRKAYYQAVAAQETLKYMEQVRTAADASAHLAKRLREAGNFSELQRAREQGFYADTAVQYAQAQRLAQSTREHLARLMGLWGSQLAFKLPERLPDLPKAPEELPNVESTAMEQRLDLRMVRLDVEAQARSLGLTRATRFINVLELEADRERTRDHGSESVKRTYGVVFELPLFDFGTARVARAEAVYMQSISRATEAAVNARSQVRDAYLSYRSSYDIARHLRDEVVPLNKKILDESLLRYNGMLIGVFDLLADARAQIASVNRAIDAGRDFWLARADLDMALIGTPSPGPAAGASSNAAN